MVIPENAIPNEETKYAVEDDLLAKEKYPPEDLINWIKTERNKTRKPIWQNSKYIMKNRKKRSNGIKTRKR
jgi:hypothetical protein